MNTTTTISTNIEIKGFVPVSLIDWPGKIASVIFLPGCNFRCSYCHNPELIKNTQNLPTISEEEIFGYLLNKKDWIDGVVITGGEPTIYPDLPQFIFEIKQRGFGVKLDTNGTNPEILEDLIKKKLIDYIAMDIKGPIEKYTEITQKDVDLKAIKKSTELIKNSDLDYEFRTTVIPDLINKDKMKEIGKWLQGAKKYFIQQFRAKDTLDPEFLEKHPYTKKELEELLEIAKPYFEICEIRGI